MATTASVEAEAVEEKVRNLMEALAKSAPQSAQGPFLEWRLTRPRRGRHKHDLTVLLSSPERVLLAELEGSSEVGNAPDESRWGAVIDVVRELLKSSLASEMPMERTRADLSPSEAEALQHGGIDLQAESSGSERVAASLNEWRKLLEGSYTTGQVAKLLGVRDSRIRQRLGGPRPTLFGFRHGNSWLIPKFQIEKRKIIRGLDVVASHVSPGLHPVAVARWFQTPNPDLLNPADEEQTLSPLDWLRTGGDPGVAATLAATL